MKREDAIVDGLCEIVTAAQSRIPTGWRQLELLDGRLDSKTERELQHIYMLRSASNHTKCHIKVPDRVCFRGLER